MVFNVMYVSMEPCGIVWFDTPTEMKQIHEDTDHMKVMNYARTPKLCFLRDRVYFQDSYSFGNSASSMLTTQILLLLW